MTAKSTLDSREFKLALAILQREQAANMPSRRQERLFRLFNLSIFSFLGIFAIAVIADTVGVVPEDVVMVLFGIVGFLVLSTVVLFFLNLGLMRTLIRQARLRRRLQLGQSLKDAFKAKRRHGRIRNVLTLIIALLGAVPFAAGGGLVLIYLAFGGDSTEFYFVLGVLFILTVLGLSLAFLHFMRRGKQRLEIVTNLKATLLGHKEAFESDQDSTMDISSADYHKIAGIERAHIIDDRAKSIKMAHKESPDSSYVIQKSREMLRAKAALDLNARALVDDQILHLMTTPLPPGVTEDPGTGYLRLSVPETSVDILYQVDKERHRIRLLALQSSAEPADLNP